MKRYVRASSLQILSPLDYQQNFATTRQVTWTCLVGNLKKWKEGKLEREICVGGKKLTLTAERKGLSGTGHEVVFCWDDDNVTFSEVLEAIGELPIPPYLNRDTEPSDLQTYQTVYSKIKGSVAAPTAGLHFTERVPIQVEANEDDLFYLSHDCADVAAYHTVGKAVC